MQPYFNLVAVVEMRSRHAAKATAIHHVWLCRLDVIAKPWRLLLYPHPCRIKKCTCMRSSSTCNRKERENKREEASLLVVQTGRRRAGSTSMHISWTIKLELPFDTSLTYCLLNKRLELQHGWERFRRQNTSWWIGVYRSTPHVRKAAWSSTLVHENTLIMPISSRNSLHLNSLRLSLEI